MAATNFKIIGKWLKPYTKATINYLYIGGSNLMNLKLICFVVIDIGANLADGVFFGNYRGKQAHPDDFEQILQRSKDAGIVAMMVTGTNLKESQEAIELCRKHDGLYSTVGCHPTRSKEFHNYPSEKGGPSKYFDELLKLIQNNRDKVVAVGECGLDYDRLHFSDKETQRIYFEKQFKLAELSGLPMFLHDRNTGTEFYDMVRANRSKFSTGVVHSFTGTAEEMKSLVDLDLYIGVNGCSLKTDENLKVVSAIPLERLMIETDCPYCEIRPSHAGYKLLSNEADNSGGDGWKIPGLKKKEKWEPTSMVKSRNEPCMIRQVIQVLAKLYGKSEIEVANAAFENTRKVFFSDREEVS
ncbi:hypothetical protein H4219_004797 [Mycoemilia scoparia]|uniref:TatD related DNase n=1 Tax=Mycoemilia scoparia TaxID=417184 RepID=A0A9W8DQR6_9FUNG|nr:hypothetical protein H4219_004797 [Mycoemilia scoparia]